MSITVHQKAAIVHPAYNDIVFLVNSTNSAQTNFRYVFDVHINGETVRVKLPGRPSDSRCVFDASRIVQSYLSRDLGTYNEAAAQYVNVTNLITYYVRFGEEYGTTPTVYADLAEANPLYAFHGGVRWPDFVGFDYTDYILTKGTATGHFLTNAPTTQNIALNQNAWMYAMVNPSGAASAYTTIRFKKYNSGNGLLGTLDVASGYAQTYGLFRTAVGPANIDAASAGWFDATVAYYTVQALDSNGSASSVLYTYTIHTACKYDIKRLHFLNRLGGMDSFNFTLASFDNRSVERNTFRKNYGSTTGTTWSYGAYERGTSQFNTKEKQIVRVTSDWISEAESLWLEELVSSPQVFIEEDSMLKAVVIESTSYDVMKKSNQQLFNIEVAFSYSFMDIRQRS